MFSKESVVFKKERYLHCLMYMQIAAFLVLSHSISFALEKMENDELSAISGQAGVTIVIQDLKVSSETGLMSIGYEKGLNIPAASEGGYIVLDSNRVVQLDIERGWVDLDVFSIPAGEDYLVNGKTAIPGGSTVACIDLGETRFNVNMSDAVMAFKLSNNKTGNVGDGITEFTKTVMDFALSGSTVVVKSDDAKMHIFSH